MKLIEPIKPPIIDLTLLNDAQWDAHFYLVFREDRIECRRGIHMTLAACQLAQETRQHIMTGETAWHDEEVTRPEFYACKDCEHYHPHKKRFTQAGVTLRKINQDKAFRAKKAPRPRKKVKAINHDPPGKGKYTPERIAASKQRLMDKAMARMAERKETLMLKKREAKKMYRAGRTIVQIARELKSRDATISGWIKEMNDIHLGEAAREGQGRNF